MKRFLMALFVAAVLGCSTPASSFAQAGPEFTLGFKALANQIPDLVGTPLENEHHGANGDGLQQTSTGLMVWRKADNWTAFTNGYWTWLNGPYGVQDRANDGPRFDWEAGAASGSGEGDFPYGPGVIPSDTTGIVTIDPSTLGPPLLPGATQGFVDLSSQLPPIGDQGKQNSCVGWAVGYYAKTYQEMLEHKWDAAQNSFSPAFIYNLCNKGGDNGCSVRDALTVVQDVGALRWSDFPYDPNDYKRQPTSEQRVAAAPFKASGFGALWDSKTKPSVDGLKVALQSGQVVVAVARVYKNRGWSVGPVIDVPGPGEAHVFDHVIAIVGFDDSKSRFKFANSLGTGWGEGGYGYLTYDFVERGDVTEAWVMFDAPNDSVVTDTPTPVPTVVTPTPAPTSVGSIRPTPTALGTPPVATIATPTSAPTSASVTVMTPTPVVAALTPVPTSPPPTASPPGVLYQADWSQWPTTQGWKPYNGELLYDGTGSGWIPIPFPADGIQDFAVEAEIQVINNKGGSFGIIARETGGKGYAAEITSSGYFNRFQGGPGWHARLGTLEERTNFYGAMDTMEFDPGTSLHKYRFELAGNRLTFLVDGAPVVEATDNRYLTGRRIGLEGDGSVQLSVRSLRVLSLSR